jgi:hypothetical protein
MQINLIKGKKRNYNSQGGIYLIRRIFQQNHIDKFIDECFPGRRKQSFYSDSDLLLGLCWNIYRGGTYFEDINRVRDDLNVPGYIEFPSSDSVKYRIEQLSESTQEIINKQTTSHEFNINNTLNRVLAKLSVRLNPDFKRHAQILDYDNTIITTLKGDSRLCYKQGYGYQPGVIFIGREPVYIEGRNGNSPSTYLMDQTLERGINMLKSEGVKIGAIRIDGAAYQHNVFDLIRRYKGIRYYIRGKNADSIWKTIYNSKSVGKITVGEREAEYIDHEWYTPGDIGSENKCRVIVYRYDRDDPQLDLYEGKYCYYVIYTDDRTSSAEKIINLYNQRGRAEQNFDRLKNDFNWSHPPFDNLAMNTAYLIFTAMGCQLYHYLLRIISKVFHELDPETRIKRFMLLFVNVVVKWTFRGRRYILNVYSDRPYDKLIYSQ